MKYCVTTGESDKRDEIAFESVKNADGWLYLTKLDDWDNTFKTDIENIQSRTFTK